MTLKMNPKMTIAELQTKFSALYPYLKIVFFTVPHKEGGTVWSKFQIFDLTKEIGDISLIDQPIVYDLPLTLTTGAFEQDFQNRFGLFIQVFRRSMDIWLATTTSDNWTLERQNQVGNESAHTLTEINYETRSLDEID